MTKTIPTAQKPFQTRAATPKTFKKIKEAIAAGNAKRVFARLKRHGMDADTIMPKDPFAPIFEDGKARSVFDYALYCEAFAIATTFLAENPGLLEKPDDTGCTPLMRFPRQPAVIAFLLQAGADVTAEDHGGNTALHIYADYAEERSIQMIAAQKGADVQKRNHAGDTPVMALVKGEKTAGAYTHQGLLETIDWASSNHDDMSFAEISALKDELHIKLSNALAALVAGGAMLDTKDLSGKTAFTTAVEAKNTYAANALLGNGADIGDITPSDVQDAAQEISNERFRWRLRDAIGARSAREQERAEKLKAVTAELRDGLLQDIKPAKKPVFCRAPKPKP